MSACYVGIDVSKDASTAQGIDEKGKKLFYVEFKMGAEVFSKLLGAIRSHCKDLSMLKAAMEATGCYHTNLLCFLAAEGIQCFVINPLLNAAERTDHGGPCGGMSGHDDQGHRDHHLHRGYQ